MIHEALHHYGFDNLNAELLRHNENMTYKITDSEKAYVLRIHKPSAGFNLDLLRSGMDKTGLVVGEMELLKYLSEQNDVQTQKVKPNNNGKFATILDDDTPVTVLGWIEGETLEQVDITAEIAFLLGVMIGKLHNILSREKFNRRYQYDSALISRMMQKCQKPLNKGISTSVT